MPDASDRIVPTFYSLSPERWERIFGKPWTADELAKIPYEPSFVETDDE